VRTVIFSDIHANLEALRAILAETASLQVDRIICLGDVVGYYADPEACVKLIRERNVLCIQGNHDAVASGMEGPTGFNPIASEVIRWTHDRLSPESRNWLASLPTKIEFQSECCGVHGSLRDRDEYLMSKVAIRSNFTLMREMASVRIVFFGHTHRRAAFTLIEGDEVLYSQEDDIDVSVEQFFLINPGGSGQPRDGIVGAPYILFEDDTVKFRITPYDVEKTVEKAVKLPYGEILAARLQRGI